MVDGSSVDGALDAGGVPPTTILLQQPDAAGIALKNVGSGLGSPPLDKTWRMVNWVYGPDERAMVPTAAGSTWDAGSKTGFTPVSPTTAQYAYVAKATGPTSTAQMEGTTVGAYVNSADLTNPPSKEKMSVWPEADWAADQAPVPYAQDGSVLTVSYELQVPTSSSACGFIHTSLLFHDNVSGQQLSLTAKVFTLDAANLGLIGSSKDTGGSPNFEMNVSVGDAYAGAMSDYLTTITGTAQTQTYGVFKPISYSISKAQFAACLAYVNTHVSNANFSTDTANYTLLRFHQNAEFSVATGGTCELGWSMRNYKLTSSH